MKRLFAAVILLFLLWNADNAGSASGKTSASSGFPQTVRVRLWYLQPPRELRLRAEAGQAQVRKCATCKPMSVTTLTLHAAGSSLRIDSDNSATAEVHISGVYQMNAAGDPPIRADFPIDVRATDG